MIMLMSMRRGVSGGGLISRGRMLAELLLLSEGVDAGVSFVLLVDDDADDDLLVRLLPDEGEPATLRLCLRWSFFSVLSGAEETTLIRVFKQSFLLAVAFVSSSEEEGFRRMI